MFKFSVGFETLDPDRRDQFLESLLDLIDEHRRGADKATIKLAHEVLTGPGGKRKIVDEQTIEPGQPMPDLRHFGKPAPTPMEQYINRTPPLESVTLSSGSRTVTLDANTRRNAEQMLRGMGGE